MNPSDALLFIFHGSEKTHCFKELKDFGNKLRRRNEIPSEVAFLSYTGNDVPKQLDRLRLRGYQNIRMIPVLLIPAPHFFMDLTAIIDKYRRSHPEIQLAVAECLGSDPIIQRGLLSRIKGHLSDVNRHKVFLVVAHGSRTAPQVEDIVGEVINSLRTEVTGAPIEESYLLSNDSEKIFSTKLAQLTKIYEEVIVVPFFLFQGRLVNMIKDECESYNLCGAEQKVHLEPTVPLDSVEKAVFNQAQLAS